MKIRNGFVSNSSSSSFLVPFEKKPETVEEMKQVLFGDKEWYLDPYYKEDDAYFSKRTAKYPAMEVAQTVFNDIRNQKPLDLNGIAEEISHGWAEGAPAYSDFEEDGEHDWEAYNEANKIFNQKRAKELLEEAGDREIYRFEYGDDDGEYFSALEHGDLFDNLGCFTISKH